MGIKVYNPYTPSRRHITDLISQNHKKFPREILSGIS